MTALYSDADQAQARSSAMAAIAVALGALALGIIGLVAALVLRARVPAMLSLSLGAMLAWFLYDLFAAPRIKYRTFLRDMAQGLSRETTGTLLSIADAPRIVEGIAVRDMLLRTDAVPGAHDDPNRLFYWDDAKSCASLAPGCHLTIVSYGRRVIGYSILSRA